MNIEDLISQYIDGELSSEAEAELHHRLSVSPEDRLLFREHVDLRDAARSRQLQHHPSRSMEMALFARLAAEEGAEIPERATEPVEVPAMTELRPLEAASVPLSRSIAADAAAVRSDRQPARRRRLIPLLVPFIIGVMAMGAFWTLFLDSPDGSPEMASNDATRPTVIAQAPPSEGTSAPRGNQAEADEASAARPESMVGSPLSDGGSVMSDAGPAYGRSSGPERGMSTESKRGRSDEVITTQSGSGMGSAITRRGELLEENARFEDSPPPPPAAPKSKNADRDWNQGRSMRGGRVVSEPQDIQTDSRDRQKDDAAEQDMAAAETPIEYQNQGEAVAPTATLSLPADTPADPPRQSAPSMERSPDRPLGKMLPQSTAKGEAPPEGTISMLGDAFFDPDRATLRSGSRTRLNYLVDLLESYPAMRIQIQGHTDSDGNEDRNNQLSEDRALAVREYLLRRGISGERMDIQAFGPNAPLAPNSTKAGKKLNRRVVVVVKDYGFRNTK